MQTKQWRKRLGVTSCKVVSVQKLGKITDTSYLSVFTNVSIQISCSEMLFEAQRNRRNIGFHIDYVFYRVLHAAACPKEGWFNFFKLRYYCSLVLPLYFKNTRKLILPRFQLHYLFKNLFVLFVQLGKF